MEKIDRLGWADGFAFRSYGVRVGVRVTDAGLLERLRTHLPPGWKPAASPVVQHLYSLIVGRSSRPNVRSFNILYRNTVRLVRSLDLIRYSMCSSRTYTCMSRNWRSGE